MSKWIISLLVVLNVSAQKGLSLFLTRVAKENLSLKADYLRYKQQASHYYSSVLPSRPQLSIERNEISSGASLNSANEKNISITQEFEFPLAYIYKHKQAVSKMDIAFQDYLEKGLKILLSAEKEFIQFILLKEKKTFLDDFLNRYSLVLEHIKKSTTVGETSEMDFLRISLEYDQLLIEQNQYESKLVSQRNILESYLPHFSEDMIDSLPIFSDLDKETLYSQFHQMSPTLKKESLNINNSELNETQQYLQRLPDFSFTYRNQEVNQIKYNGFEFGLSIPLWLPKEIEEIEIASIETDISEIQSKSEERVLSMFLNSRWNNYQTEKINWNRFKTDLLPKSEKVFSIAQKQYKAGETSYFEFIDNYRLWKNIRISELDQRVLLLDVQADLTQMKLIKYLEMKDH